MGLQHIPLGARVPEEITAIGAGRRHYRGADVEHSCSLVFCDRPSKTSDSEKEKKWQEQRRQETTLQSPTFV